MSEPGPGRRNLRAAPRPTDGNGRTQALLKGAAEIRALASGALAIDCPTNLLPHVAQQAILRGDRHVFVRPFSKAMSGGIIDAIGGVRYGLIQLNEPGPLRAAYSSAYVRDSRVRKEHPYLPGRLHLFLGDTSRMSQIDRPEPFMHCDHLTFEPGGKRGSPLVNVHLTETRPVGARNSAPSGRLRRRPRRRSCGFACRRRRQSTFGDPVSGSAIRPSAKGATLAWPSQSEHAADQQPPSGLANLTETFTSAGQLIKVWSVKTADSRSSSPIHFREPAAT